MENTEKSKLNYELDLIIDDTALDVELLNQASLFMKYAKHLAQTKRDLDEIKQNLDICKAELDLHIREHPEQYDIAKITEGAIQSAILTSKKYKDSFKKYLDTKYETDMASNAVSAMNQRKEALEGVIKLLGMQYFAGPRIPRDLTEERQKKANAQVGSMTRQNRPV